MKSTEAARQAGTSDAANARSKSNYFFIRGTQLDVQSLYRRGGPYEYSRGINPRAIAALVAGVFIALIGLFVPPVRWLYDYAWFVGFGMAAAVYVALMRGVRVETVGSLFKEQSSAAMERKT
jgi:nucleobase:cation symporter-1, NCS1 family